MVIITAKTLILGHYFRPASLVHVNHAVFSCVPMKSQSIALLNGPGEGQQGCFVCCVWDSFSLAALCSPELLQHCILVTNSIILL